MQDLKEPLTKPIYGKESIKPLKTRLAHSYGCLILLFSKTYQFFMQLLYIFKSLKKTQTF